MALMLGNLISENHQSIETSIGGWASFANGSSSVVQSATQALDGTKSISSTRNATAGAVVMASLTQTADMPTTVAGKQYTFTYWVWSPAGGTWNAFVDWYQSGNTTFISTTVGNNYTAAASAWTMIGRSDTQHVAPALGATGRIYLQSQSGTSTGQICYFDQIYFGIPPNQGGRPGLIVPTKRASLF